MQGVCDKLPCLVYIDQSQLIMQASGDTHGISIFWRLSGNNLPGSNVGATQNSGWWVADCSVINSPYHHPIERQISNSHGCGPSSGGKNSKIGFPLMRKIM